MLVYLEQKHFSKVDLRDQASAPYCPILKCLRHKNSNGKCDVTALVTIFH